MKDRPKFRVSFSKIKLKASCTARNQPAENDQSSPKTKMEKRRIRRRFEKMNHED